MIAILALFVASIGMMTMDRSADTDQDNDGVPPELGIQTPVEYIYWDSEGNMVEASCVEYTTMSGTHILHTTMYTG